MAQLSFADLLERRVPLTSAEATALTLAAAECGPIPDADEILLSSTGDVTFAAPALPSGRDDDLHIAMLLHRLLRLDEPDAVQRRGRVPGGLLVVLARTMRQIDLPPLSSDAFRDALGRFGPHRDAAILAAVFWRAARTRRRSGSGVRALPASWTTSDRGSRSPDRRSERRAQGPSAAELRRWLRQAEREVYVLRQSRAHKTGAVVMGTLVLVVALGVGASIGRTEREGERVPASTPTQAAVEPSRSRAPAATGPRAVTVTQPAEPTPATRTATRAAAPMTTPVARPPKAASTQQPRPDAATPHAKRVRTVQMVNLPRASWAVVR